MCLNYARFIIKSLIINGLTVIHVNLFFSELQTDKTSTEVDIEVIAEKNEATRKVTKMAKNPEYVDKTEEEPKKVTYFRVWPIWR